MKSYILRRLLLMIPTLLGITVVCFTLIQFVPGGPVEEAISLLDGGRREFFRGFKAETDSPNMPVVRPLLDAWLGWPVALVVVLPDARTIAHRGVAN